MEIHREDAVELEEDCYFLADLRECTVFDTDGKELGKDVMRTCFWVSSHPFTFQAYKSV